LLTGDWTTGYYNLTSKTSSLKAYDLRAYSQLALHLWSEGILIEDNTHDYLITAESTMIGTPVALHFVTTAAMLTAAAKAEKGLTYASILSLDLLWLQALQWNQQYSSMPVFVSTGKGLAIRRFPCAGVGGRRAFYNADEGMERDFPCDGRVWTLGSERFVTGLNLKQLNISVSSETGLDNVAIWNGRVLYRRFGGLHGVKAFHRTLMMDGSTQKDLVLIATDTAGGKATSFAHRNWKAGGRAPVFCGDHYNDCRGDMIMWHGPGRLSMGYLPQMPGDIAGGTWDGGPIAKGSIFSLSSQVELLTGTGPISGSRMTQIPRLQLCDEGAVAVSMVYNREINAQVQHVANTWNTYGPIDKAEDALIHFNLTHREWQPANVGVPHEGYAWFAITGGSSANLFRTDIRFKRAIANLTYIHVAAGGGGRSSMVDTLTMLWSATADGTVHELPLLLPGSKSAPTTISLLRVENGGWWGAVSPNQSATMLYHNTGGALTLNVTHNGISTYGISVHDAALATGASVAAGDSWRAEIFNVAVDMMTNLQTVEQLAQLQKYLVAPTGLQVVRGTLKDTNHSLTELVPDAAGVAELSVLSLGVKVILISPCVFH
jgi:hypothetical protein